MNEATDKEIQSGFGSGFAMMNNQRSIMAGRPPITGRAGKYTGKKFSVYMTKEKYNLLDDLRKYDETDLQDLINEAIDVFFEHRKKDIDFLKEQEKARRERKAKKSSE